MFKKLRAQIFKKSINFSFFQGPENFLQAAVEIRWSLKESIQFQ